jgi:hypothetical protein
VTKSKATESACPKGHAGNCGTFKLIRVKYDFELLEVACIILKK